MDRLKFILIVLLAFFLSCQSNETVQDSNHSERMIIEKLVGTWSLLEWTAKSPEGEITYPFGRDAKGRIMYDRLGNMSVQLARNERSLFESDDPWIGTTEEIQTAFLGFFAYYGTYSLDEENRIITHHLGMCSFPNWIGTKQQRFFKFDGEKLILTTPPIVAEHVDKINILVWQKEL